MHIICTNCKKKFEIEENLIPGSGRLLQCGICNHKWFYKKEEEEETKEDEVEKKIEKNIETFTNKIIKEKKEKKNSVNIFKIFLVSIISIVALMVIIDTFKHQIIKLLPEIEFILNNLYQSLLDIVLFFKDLIK